MKKRVCCLVICVLLLAPMLALAAGKVTVTQEAFYVRSFLSYHAAELYVEVTNTGDKPVIYNGGMVELYNPEGDAIESDNLYSCYPEVLAPGESGYIYRTVSVDEATEPGYIDDYMLTISGKAENEKKTLRLEAGGVYETYQRNKYWSEEVVFATITNTTKDTLRGLRVVFVLFDKDDKLMYANSTELYSVGVPAGQTVEVRDTVDSRLVEAWEAEGVKPARVEVIAYVEIEP